jgi:hypothetical protein
MEPVSDRNWSVGLVIDLAAGCHFFGSRLVRVGKSVVVWYDQSAGLVWSVWLHDVYGVFLAICENGHCWGSVPSLRERLRFRTGWSSSWIRWLRVRLDG